MWQHQRNRETRHSTGRAHPHEPGRWRVGNAIVSTEELQSWQLGPLLNNRDARTGTPPQRNG
jgi:hypothetical protein